jgi:Colicin D
MTTTSAVVDQLQAAAGVARSGASDLDAARARVQYAVEDAHTAGFEMGEDLSVTDRMTGGSAAQRVARQAAAQAFAGNIGQRAAQLVALDAQVAGKVTAAVAGVGATFPRIPAPVAPPIGGGVRAVDNRTFKQGPPSPLPVDPKDMRADEARAEWAKVNAEIQAWNACCGVENVGPLPPAQYSACVASRGPLLERQAATRARLGQLGIPVEGEGPASPGEPGGGGTPPLISEVPLQTDRAQIEAKYKHAADFGVTDPRGSAGFDNFDSAVKQVVDDPATLHIQGTFRGQPAILNYNPDSGLCVIQSPDGKFISGWKLDPEQAANVTSRGTLGGG